MTLQGPTPQYTCVGRLAHVIWWNSDLALAEELKDASRILPLSMMWTAVLNGVLGWIMLVTFCFCIGDVETALETPTGYPFIQVTGIACHYFVHIAEQKIDVPIIDEVTRRSLRHDHDSNPSHYWRLHQQCCKRFSPIVVICPRRRSPIFQVSSTRGLSSWSC